MSTARSVYSSLWQLPFGLCVYRSLCVQLHVETALWLSLIPVSTARSVYSSLWQLPFSALCLQFVPCTVPCGYCSVVALVS